MPVAASCFASRRDAFFIAVETYNRDPSEARRCRVRPPACSPSCSPPRMSAA